LLGKRETSPVPHTENGSKDFFIFYFYDFGSTQGLVLALKAQPQSFLSPDLKKYII
jgi:hypothetical protein